MEFRLTIEFGIRRFNAFILVRGSVLYGSLFLRFRKAFKFGKFGSARPRIVQFTIDSRQQIVRLRCPRIGADCRQEFVFCFRQFLLALIALPKENVHLWRIGLRLLSDH